MCFLVALDKVLKDYGNLQAGLHVTEELILTDLEFADDAAMPNDDADQASGKLTLLSEKSGRGSWYVQSIPK